MSRPPLVLLAAGVLALAALLALALAGGAVMPSYLGAWLFVLALPLGALPVVMGLELMGLPEGLVTALLRRLVATMPLAAALAVPVLLKAKGLFPALGVIGDGLPGWWMTEPFFLARAVVFLGVWTALAFVFSRPAASFAAGGRRALLAGAGLALHFVMGTLAADDWAQAVEPSFNSSAFGVLLIAAQAGIAVSLAVAMAATGRRPTLDHRDGTATRHLGTVLAVLLGAWGFLAFTQYLVVWSANLPKEVAWYQHRAAGIGQAAEDSAAILCFVALLCLLSQRLPRAPGVLAWVAAAVVVLHGVEMLWLVTPAFRATFSLTLADLLALAGAAGLGIGVATLLGERFLDRGRFGHGAA